jgi:hypothetical protein
MIFGDQRVQLALDLGLVQHELAHVEVEPRAIGADLAAGDTGWNHGAKQMHAGVHAHMSVPPRPVNLGDDTLADRRCGLSRCQNMQHLPGRCTLAGICDRKRMAVAAAHRTAIAGLAAAGRIKNRAVQLHAVGAGGRHSGLDRPQIRVFAK